MVREKGYLNHRNYRGKGQNMSWGGQRDHRKYREKGFSSANARDSTQDKMYWKLTVPNKLLNLNLNFHDLTEDKI